MTSTKWHWLQFDFPDPPVWVLHRDIIYDDWNEQELRERYHSLKCSGCRKIDEDAALRLGFDSDMRIESRRDCLQTFDGFVLISSRAERTIRDAGLSGVCFLPLPCGRYSIMQPVDRLRYDSEKAGVAWHKPCPACGRFHESRGIPNMTALALPADPMRIVAFEPRLEGGWGRKEHFILSGTVRNLLKGARLTGLRHL